MIHEKPFIPFLSHVLISLQNSISVFFSFCPAFTLFISLMILSNFHLQSLSHPVPGTVFFLQNQSSSSLGSISLVFFIFQSLIFLRTAFFLSFNFAPCKPAMTCLKYQVYLYSSEDITYLNAILWVVTEPALWDSRLPPCPTYITGRFPPPPFYGSITFTHLVKTPYLCYKANEKSVWLRNSHV